METTIPGRPRTGLKWLIIGLTVAGLLFVAFLIGDSLVRRNYEPYLRRQAILYLQNRFQCDVELASLRLDVPYISPIQALLNRGRGVIVHVKGTGLSLRKRSPGDLPPLMTISSFAFNIDAGKIFEVSKVVEVVELDGVNIILPPKGRQTDSDSGAPPASATDITIKDVVAHDVSLSIVPAISGKKPLTFAISALRLRSVGKSLAMSYDAQLTNPKPRGLIRSTGSFGPWLADDPGGTPLEGDYTFDRADLAVFPAIAGILNSKGHFSGTLSAINAEGDATVPDFRLRSAGNAIGLFAHFKVLVDGQNGNTILQPVQAVLGGTHLTTSGAVIRKNGDPQRTVSLDVSIPSGNLKDVLRVAMKGSPMMEGKLSLRTRITIPPLSTKVADKLILDGEFHIDNGRFLRSDIQGKIDALSRRGQGQPKSSDISDVFSDMKGEFHLKDQTITFPSLSFGTPGADIQLAGSYSLANDALDFRGSLSLQAHVSQTMTGWKRWALKPADRFFAKNGAGTFLRIRIDGDSQSPHFGLDHGKPEPAAESR